MSASTTTLAAAIDRFDVDVDPHLDRALEIPVLSGLQRQGDVMIVPCGGEDATRRVPASGTPVVKGENGGNTHLLLADGDVFYDPHTPRSAQDLLLGVMTVADESTGFLAHPEHGYMGFAPGRYTVLRQREQADTIRIVAD